MENRKGLITMKEILEYVSSDAKKACDVIMNKIDFIIVNSVYAERLYKRDKSLQNRIDSSIKPCEDSDREPRYMAFEDKLTEIADKIEEWRGIIETVEVINSKILKEDYEVLANINAESYWRTCLKQNKKS